MRKKKDLPESLVLANDNVKKFLEFAYNIQNTDKEVILRTLDEIPDFASVCKSSIDTIEESTKLMYQSNDESMISFHNTCQTYIESCRELLKNKDLSFNQQAEILDRIERILKLMAEKDSENKRYNDMIHARNIGAIGGMLLMLGALITGFLRPSSKNSSSEDSEDSKELDPHYDYEE